MLAPLRRIPGIFRTLSTPWNIAGLTLVAILLFEALLQVLFAVKDHIGSPETPDRRVIEEGYGGETWAIQHYRELEALRERWQPYVYFRQRPFSGRTIAIDVDGLRRTWQPPPARPEDGKTRPIKLLMLGGSSLWGYGARDDQTIPSLVAKKLDGAGCRVEMRNLAEIGYVSTQEVIALVRELQVGYRPDLVIFYDGVNDATSALLEGEAGVTTNERNRRYEFNLRQSPARLGGALIARVVRDSSIFRLARVMGRRIIGQRGAEAGLPSSDRRGELASEVVDRYRANLAIVDRLGHGFGFRSLFFWQPVVFDKKTLRPYEREEAGKLLWGRTFLRDVYDGIRASPELRADRRFHDLSRLFEDTEGLVFIDYCHTTEAANDRIAEAIARRALEALREPAPERRDGGPRGEAVR